MAWDWHNWSAIATAAIGLIAATVKRKDQRIGEIRCPDCGHVARFLRHGQIVHLKCSSIGCVDLKIELNG